MLLPFIALSLLVQTAFGQPVDALTTLVSILPVLGPAPLRPFSNHPTSGPRHDRIGEKELNSSRPRGSDGKVTRT